MTATFMALICFLILGQTSYAATVSKGTSSTIRGCAKLLGESNAEAIATDVLLLGQALRQKIRGASRAIIVSDFVGVNGRELILRPMNRGTLQTIRAGGSILELYPSELRRVQLSPTEYLEHHSESLKIGTVELTYAVSSRTHADVVMTSTDVTEKFGHVSASLPQITLKAQNFMSLPNELALREGQP